MPEVGCQLLVLASMAFFFFLRWMTVRPIKVSVLGESWKQSVSLLNYQLLLLSTLGVQTGAWSLPQV